MADHNSQAASYIHTVHHLIEKCLVFNMSKHECMEALSKHANIQPLITSTVWDELEKVNRDFFQGYPKGKEAIKPKLGAEDQTPSSPSDSSASQ